MKKLPNLFIIGFPRCGTTTISRILASHPAIFIPRNNELSYFAKDLNQDLSKRKYLNYFKKRNERFLGDATPNYILSEVAVKSIHTMSPHAKILINIRNPVEAMHSLYIANQKAGIENRNFREAIRSSMHSSDIILDSKFRLHYSWIYTYADKIRGVYNYFEKSNIKVNIFENMIGVDEALVEIFRFLSVDETFKFQWEKLGSSGQVRHLTLHKLIRNLKGNSLLRKLPKQVRNLGNVAKRLNTKEINRKPPSADIRKEILAHHRDDIKALEKLLDKDLSFWK